MRLAHTLWLLGRADDAAQMRDATIALAEAGGHPYSRAVADVWGAMLAVDQGDEEQLRERSDALGSAAGRGARQVHIPTEMFAGLVDVLDGRVQEGIARVRRVQDESASGEPAAPGEAGMLARVLIEACALGGDSAAGLAAADHALGLGFGAQLWEAEFSRLRGEFLDALGAADDDVEAALERALEVAEGQDAQALVSRAHRSLDRFRAERSEERSRNGTSSSMPIDDDRLDEREEIRDVNR
jgi:hypothetical protein